MSQTRPVGLSRWGNSRHPGQSDITFGCGAAVVVVIALFIVSLVFVGWPVTVDAGDTCVITRGGDPKSQESGGFVFINAFETRHCYSNRPITIQAVVGSDDKVTATYKMPPVDASSADGQYIVAVPYSITFTIPDKLPDYDPVTLLPLMADTAGNIVVPDAPVIPVADATPGAAPVEVAAQAVVPPTEGLEPVYVRADNISYVYENVAIDQDKVVSVVKPRFEAEIKTVVQLYPSDVLFAGDLTIPSDTLYERLFPVFHGYGLWLDSAKIASPQFNQDFVDRREAAQLAEQDIEIAQNQAQATVAAAEGQATSVSIAAGASNQATIEAAHAQATSIAAVSGAEATATSQAIAAQGGPEYAVQLAEAEAMGNWNVTTIIGDGGVLPVMEVGGPPPEPTVEPTPAS
jgi:regulator of protease activity HflC (stomatin/prohibitin superfamily)